MTVITLLNELHKELKPKHDTDLAEKLNVHPSVMCRMRSRKDGKLSDTFLVRCFDYAGFPLAKTRELFGREE